VFESSTPMLLPIGTLACPLVIGSRSLCVCVCHIFSVTLPVVIFITLGEQERSCGISKLVKSKTVRDDSVTIVSRVNFCQFVSQ